MTSPPTYAAGFILSLAYASYPNFSFTKVNIAVAILTTMNVAIARQTASDSVNFQMARIHRTVQTTSETVMMIKAIHLTISGFTTPRVFFGFSSTTTSGSCGMRRLYQINDCPQADNRDDQPQHDSLHQRARTDVSYGFTR